MEKVIETPSESKSLYYLCRTCSNPVAVSDSNDPDSHCSRCGEKAPHRKKSSAQATLAFALTALFFFIPANLFPFMSIELYGRRNASTIWEGVVSLVNDGSWPIGVVVFLASLVIPFLKLVALFYLSLTAHHGKHSRFKTKIYHITEAIGRWSMLDIFLLAVLVAIMKLGRWTHVEPRIGSLFFLFVVIFTMLSSAFFDPQLLWKDEDEQQSSEKKEF